MCQSLTAECCHSKGGYISSHSANNSCSQILSITWEFISKFMIFLGGSFPRWGHLSSYWNWCAWLWNSFSTAHLHLYFVWTYCSVSETSVSLNMASQYVFSSGFLQQFSKALYFDLIQIYLHNAVLNQAIYKCLFWLMVSRILQDSNINQITFQMRGLKYMYSIFRTFASSCL